MGISAGRNRGWGLLRVMDGARISAGGKLALFAPSDRVGVAGCDSPLCMLCAARYGPNCTAVLQAFCPSEPASCMTMLPTNRALHKLSHPRTGRDREGEIRSTGLAGWLAGSVFPASHRGAPKVPCAGGHDTGESGQSLRDMQLQRSQPTRIDTALPGHRAGRGGGGEWPRWSRRCRLCLRYDRVLKGPRIEAPSLVEMPEQTCSAH